MNVQDFDIFKKIPSLKTERLILRKIEKSDLDDIFEYSSDPEISKYLLWSKHENKRVTKRYLSDVLKKYKSGQFYDWAIDLDGKMIGICGFSRIDVLNDTAEAGYIVARPYQGKGIASEALKAVLEFGFKTLRLNVIKCISFEENTASRSVMKKCGMKEEGIIKNHAFQNGTVKNAVVASITKEEMR